MAITFGAVSIWGSGSVVVMQSPTTRVTAPAAAVAAYSNEAFQFPGGGAVGDSTVDGLRIQIATDSTDVARHPMNQGTTDMSHRFFFRVTSGEAASAPTLSSGTICGATSYSFTSSDIFFDNDRTAGDSGGYGAGVFRDTDNSNALTIIWSASNTAGTTTGSACSPLGTDLGNGAWWEILMTWDQSTGDLAVYADGTRGSLVTGPTGDISMALATSFTGTQPWLAWGREKHGIVSGQTFDGALDEWHSMDTLYATGTTYTICSGTRCGMSANRWTRILWHADIQAENDSGAVAEGVASTRITYWRVEAFFETGMTRVASTADSDWRPNVDARVEFDVLGLAPAAIMDSANATIPFSYTAGAAGDQVLDTTTCTPHTITATTTEGFPTTNFMAIDQAECGASARGGWTALGWPTNTLPGIPNVGDTMVVRYLKRVTVPDTSLANPNDFGNHDDEPPQQEPLEMGMDFDNVTAGDTMYMTMPSPLPDSVTIEQERYPPDFCEIGTFDGRECMVKDRVYTIWIMFAQVAADEYRMDFRVFTADGRLRWDGSDMENIGFSDTLIDADFFWGDDQTNGLTGWAFGISGTCSDAVACEGQPYSEVAGIIVADNDPGLWPLPGYEGN